MNIKNLLCMILLLTVVFSFNAQATEVSFLSKNIDLEGQSSSFLVVKTNVNVRAEPNSKAKRIAKLDRRDIVTVLGKVKNKNWYAVRRNGLDLGYVYSTSITPLINGEIEDNLIGNIDLTDEEKPDCSYEISYAGRTSEEDIVFISSDYLANFTCRLGFDMFRFSANIFMAEIPFDLGGKPVFQIALDFPEIAAGYEDFLSVTASFDADNNKVSLDQVSLKQYKEQKPIKARSAETPIEALTAATHIQLSALNTKAWQTIAGKIAPPETKPNE